ncbi:aminotransferase class IV [Laceyella putida]|uniref:Aminotransferase class IV n=1 Tax=Laceyella putida TaxID=110101 RepID=A0ABW2RQW4_9BACL
MMLDGQPIEEAEARLSVLDHGFLYGVGAFETLRIYQGFPFLIDDHLERLALGLSRQRIRSPYQREEWLTQIGELLHLAGLLDASLRIMVTGGEEGLGLNASEYEQPHVLMFIRPLPFRDGEWFAKGKALDLVSIPRQAPGGASDIKSNNYLNSVLARQQVDQFPQAEGLMLTPDGYLAEGIVSNLFFVRDGILHTPSLELGILAGVTRKWVISLAQSLGMEVREGKYRPSALDEAEEIFITNSIQEIVPIRRWQGRLFKEHPITTSLYEAYRSWTTTCTSARELGRRM